MPRVDVPTDFREEYVYRQEMALLVSHRRQKERHDKQIQNDKTFLIRHHVSLIVLQCL